MRHKLAARAALLLILVTIAAGALLMGQEAVKQPDPEHIKAQHEKLLIKHGLKIRMEMPNVKVTWLHKAAQFFGRLFMDFAPILLALSFAALLLLIFWMTKDVPGNFRSTRRGKHKQSQSKPEPPAIKSAAQLYAEATRLAGAGDYQEALSFLHKASIFKLVTTAIIPPADHLTNNEIRRAIPGNHPWSRTFQQLAAQSELATFKGDAVDAATFERMKTLYDQNFGAAE